MVDFNNETTVTRPSADIVRVLILQRRNDLIEAFEFYEKKKSTGIAVDIGLLQSRLFSLFLELQASLKRREKEDYDRLCRQVRSRKYEELLDAFLFINEFLDKMKLTQIDTHVALGGNIIERNKAHGVPI
jgi:hypothetical protein